MDEQNQSFFSLHSVGDNDAGPNPSLHIHSRNNFLYVVCCYCDCHIKG